MIYEHEDYQCYECGIKDSQMQFANQKGWTYAWLKVGATLNCGYKRWTCSNCLMLLLSGVKPGRIQK